MVSDVLKQYAWSLYDNLGGLIVANLVWALTSLPWLMLGNNQISDLSPLSGLTSLTRLWLNLNQISDIGPLSGLTSLGYLELSLNQISDIGPLVTNSDNGGLGSYNSVYLSYNPLSAQAINVDVPYLESKGVIVKY